MTLGIIGCALLASIALWQTWSAREWRAAALIHRRNTEHAMAMYGAVRDLDRVATGVIDAAQEAIRARDSRRLARELRDGIGRVAAAEQVCIAKLRAAGEERNQ